MGLPLRGKTAVVTGASQGIGRAIAVRLATDGADCVLAARDRTALEQVATDIRALQRGAEVQAVDLRDPDAPAAVVSAATRAYGAVDIIVNSAGATRRAPFLELADADWQDGFALKFFGAVRLIRAAWPHLKRSRGSIVNIAGIGGRTPGPAFALGGSVNAALLSLTKSLAAAGVEDGIQVNAINPGAVRTDRLQKRLRELAAAQGADVDAAEQRFIAGERVTRIGEPADIAGLVAFVVGPQGRFLQGALIDIDGGATKTI